MDTHMRIAFKSLAFFTIFGLASTYAQLDRFIPIKNQPLWKADTLYIGASFIRSSFEPVKIWLIGNEAGWTGNLYFIEPSTKAEKFLFTNHGTPNQVIVLSDLYDIPVGDTVYFVYRVVSGTNDVNSKLPKWTGPNIPGQSQYVTGPTSVKYGHRWSVAGRVNDSLVQFGFEDDVSAGSDMDYDDIIFGTTLSLSLEEVPASLTFTDKTGKALPPGSFWSPINDTVYISYTDDYVKGNISKEVVLKVVNRKGAAPGDNESFIVAPLTRNAATGIWQAKIPISEFPGGIPGDQVLQTYFIGEVTAQVKSHNRLGVLDGNTLTTNLNIAYPDKPETIKVKNCMDPAADITRLTNCVSIEVTDQNPTRLPKDTIYAEIRCDATGDVVSKVALIEQADGTFKSEDIVKNEGVANSADPILSCKNTDNITATYVDEIYGTRITYKVAFNGDQPEDFYFAKNGDLLNKITTIKDGDAPFFLAVIKTATPNVDVVDQIAISFTTPQGEIESLIATETGPNTGVFTVQVPFEFTTLVPVPGDKKITGYLSPTQAVSNVVVTASAVVGAKTFTSNITLLPALNIVTLAYIKDENGNGAGDHVYLVFTRPLEAVPDFLNPVYWNGTTGAINGKPPKLSIMPGHPNVLVADFSEAPFPIGLTSIATGQTPTATLPSTNIFAGQKPVISDSMGPIIDSAKVHPFNPLALVPGATGLGVDTVTVYVSEPMKTLNDWQDLLRFSKPTEVNGIKSCTDYVHSAPIISEVLVQESADHKSFTLLVSAGKGATPLAGDCVYITVNGIYTDVLKNMPPVHGEILKGKKPPRQIELFRGYPPVVGLTANNPGFVLVNNDPKSDQGSEFSTKVGTVFQTQWIPPADFILGQNYVGSSPIGGVATGSVGMDPTRWVALPNNLATVQVISTGEYIADITIFDNLGNFVKAFRQSFGYRGELNNQERAAKRGLASFLVWNLKNEKGQVAGQGVYVWKVVFQFKNNKQEIRYTRTGVTRTAASYTP
jgi:hypothetical protein